MKTFLATDGTQMKYRSGVGQGSFYEESRKAGTEEKRPRFFSCLPALLIKSLFLLWLLLASARLASATHGSDFEAANKLFEQGKFADAAAGYERLLTNGPTAALHFNLGNARFKSGQPGRAIYHYHQALRLAPRDPDARGNLQFARRSLGATVEENLGQHLLRRNTLDEWAWLAGVGFGAWFLLLGLGEALPIRRVAFAGLTRGVGVLALLLAALFGVAHWERNGTRRGWRSWWWGKRQSGPARWRSRRWRSRCGTARR